MTEKNQEATEKIAPTPYSTRSQSRQAQRSKKEPKSKKKKTIMLVVGFIAVISLIIYALMAFVVKFPLHVNSTPQGVSSPIKFQNPIIPPDGWKALPIIEDSEKPELEQRAAILENTDGTCEYLRQIFFAPANQAGRGDDYLTRNYLYQLAETNNVDISQFASVNIATDKKTKPLELLTFDYPVTATIDDKQVTGQRAVAVRAIDSLQATGDESIQGIPFVSLSYSCQSQKDFNSEVWDTLLKNTQIVLHSDNS